MNVFSIERFATKDGPGIRTVVFLKGCNLRCAWCQNPESQTAKAQVMYTQELCTGCGRCVDACPVGAISYDEAYGFISDSNLCTACNACVDVCLYDARSIMGKQWHEELLLAELLKDKPFFDESGGGVTFSGGEPLLHGDALVSFATALKRQHIHLAVETAACVPWSVFEQLLPLIDLFYVDIKHLDPEKHEKFTGSGNSLILDNIIALDRSGANVVIRTPVIPGFNDTEEELREIFSFLKNRTALQSVELLPFNRLGLAKYSGLGLPYAYAHTKNMTDEDVQPFARMGKEYGLSVQAGAQ
ncbi:MAG: glycyl-radical enzyme activating protein [Sphaerochaeta sp.]|nr:glycyl-radical enzyme activating protein [Sphaerochaeta sp.]